MWNIEDIKNEMKLFMNKVSDEHKKNCYNAIDEMEIIISKRMTKCKGMFQFRSSNNKISPISIKISQNLLDCYSDEAIKYVIHHELIHMIVITYLNKNVGHNEDFKKMCRLYDVREDTYFTSKPVKDIPIDIFRYSLVCAECGKVYNYNRLTTESKKRKVRSGMCGECHSKLVLLDRKENTAIIRWGFDTKVINTMDLKEYDYNIKTK